jgi:hypothetical protein
MNLYYFGLNEAFIQATIACQYILLCNLQAENYCRLQGHGPPCVLVS